MNVRNVLILVAAILLSGALLGGSDLFVMAVWSVLGVLAYFVPSIVADYLDVSNKGSIVVINLLAGWTVIGWVVALVMAAQDGDLPGQERFGKL